MCLYLTPPRKGVYYFQRPIPERLRPMIGQREWIYSLKVKDREEAKRLIPYETIRTDQLLAAAEKALADAQPKDFAQIAIQRRAATQQWDQAEEEQAQHDMRRKDDAETGPTIPSQPRAAPASQHNLGLPQNGARPNGEIGPKQ